MGFPKYIGRFDLAWPNPVSSNQNAEARPEILMGELRSAAPEPAPVDPPPPPEPPPPGRPPGPEPPFLIVITPPSPLACAGPARARSPSTTAVTSASRFFMSALLPESCRLYSLGASSVPERARARATCAPFDSEAGMRSGEG